MKNMKNIENKNLIISAIKFFIIAIIVIVSLKILYSYVPVIYSIPFIVFLFAWTLLYFDIKALHGI